MTPDNLLFLSVICLYLSGTVLYLLGVLWHARTLRRVSYIAAIAGFILHSACLGLSLREEAGTALLRGEFYFSLLAWSLLLIFFFLWWRLRMDFLGLLASPFALILFLSSQAVGGARQLPETLAGLFFGLHIGSLFLSISLLAMACGTGAGYLFLERKIKTKEKLSGFARALPSLSTFDRANQWAVTGGFPLYTIGLVSGFLWAKLTWQRIFSWDPKEVVAIFIWLLFAFLFHQRLFMGWRGRKTAWLAIWVFSLSIVSMLVINFFMPTHHSFAS